MTKEYLVGACDAAAGMGREMGVSAGIDLPGRGWSFAAWSRANASDAATGNGT